MKHNFLFTSFLRIIIQIMKIKVKVFSTNAKEIHFIYFNIYFIFYPQFVLLSDAL